ncbi:hypothetical protein BDZ89DRAFT_1084107 [Hymenopellis radicata]|nr:hypothetical protein BDZ89DRAFT_1084107 [Hymenopellis radicata]
MATTTPSTECAICVSLYKDAVSVPCGHVFCLPCLQAYIARSCKDMMAPCPTCRVMFPCVTPDPNLIAKNLQQHIHPSIRKLFIDIQVDGSELAKIKSALAASSSKANNLAADIERRDRDIAIANRKIEELKRLLGEMNDIRAGKIKAEMQVEALKRELEDLRGCDSPVNVKQEADLDLDLKVKKERKPSPGFLVSGARRASGREAERSSLEDRLEPPRKRFRSPSPSSSWFSRPSPRRTSAAVRDRFRD